ncbi:hypothetical protein [Streptomyces sp. NPDC059371]|uniref:hypothetical protein n=1 Tax=Streptomyces sp. NPDC059371 TaxID=3346812 RepID=UPI0036BAEE81
MDLFERHEGWDVKTLVEEAVAEVLRGGGGEGIRLYVASCAERMAPLFVGLRAGAPGREADLAVYVEAVRDLWHADRPLVDAAERVRLLERFPELQPTEEGITDVADTYAFFAALCLRYALLGAVRPIKEQIWSISWVMRLRL